MEPWFQDPTVAEKDAAAAKLMKNLIFAPTHRSYEKHASTMGHQLGSFMHEDGGTWTVLPFVCRDSTKLAPPCRARVPRDDQHKNARLIYVAYGNAPEPPTGSTIMYNLDDQHGVALGTHIKYHTMTSGSTFIMNKLDHQLRYVLYRLTEMHGARLKIADPKEIKELVEVFKWKEYKTGISLLVVDGLSAEMKTRIKTTSTAPMTDEDREATDTFSVMRKKLSEYTSACNDVYVNGGDPLLSTRCVATLKWAKVPMPPARPATPPSSAPAPAARLATVPLGAMMAKKGASAKVGEKRTEPDPIEVRDDSDSENEKEPHPPPSKKAKADAKKPTKRPTSPTRRRRRARRTRRRRARRQTTRRPRRPSPRPRRRRTR